MEDDIDHRMTTHFISVRPSKQDFTLSGYTSPKYFRVRQNGDLVALNEIQLALDPAGTYQIRVIAKCIGGDIVILLEDEESEALIRRSPERRKATFEHNQEIMSGGSKPFKISYYRVAVYGEEREMGYRPVSKPMTTALPPAKPKGEVYVKAKRPPLLAEKKSGYYLRDGLIVEYYRRLTLNAYVGAYSVVGSVTLAGLTLFGLSLPETLFGFGTHGLALIMSLVAPGSGNDGVYLANKRKSLFSHPKITNEDAVREPHFQEAIKTYIVSHDDVEWWEDQFERLNLIGSQMKFKELEKDRLNREDYAANAEIYQNLLDK